MKINCIGLFAGLFLLPLLGNAQMTGFISSDQITGHYLDANDRSAVVLIHGWTGEDLQNAPISAFDGGAWPQLVNTLYTRLNGTGTRLILFHWEEDASTGPLGDWNIPPFAFVATGFANASAAAANAFANGTRLADQLKQAAPNLRKIVFVAHSAGSWAAYRAIDKLLRENPYVIVELVLLDPFIPGVSPSLATPLNTATMGELKSHPDEERIYRLANYFSKDGSDIASSWGFTIGGDDATSQSFNWRSRDINHRVDYTSLQGKYYWEIGAGYGHGGPIRFYADTVTATIGSPVPNGLAFAPWSFTSYGYYRGLVNEGFLLPSIITHPQTPQPTQQGDNAALQVVASRASSYLWFRNGVSTGVITPSINLLATTANEGDYVVRVMNSAGQVFSDKASFTVATASSKPTITTVSPRTLSGRPLPQTQRITILGTLFSSSSRLTFFDGVDTYPSKVPLSVSSTELKFDIAVGPNAANWTVKVVNGAVESDPFAFSVTSAADITAPLAPAGLSVSRWASGNQFLLDWTNPGDASGIAKAWLKIGSTPASPTDGIAYPLPANKPLRISLPVSSGSQSVHLWLEDGAGNRNQNSRATIAIGTDVTSPALLITSPSVNPLTTAQSSVVLNGSYGDDLSGVVSVLWQNFPSGSGAATLTSSGLGGTWTTPAITLRPGLNIIGVTATDAAGNVGSTTMQVTYVDTSNSGSLGVGIQPQGAVDAGAQWRLAGETVWRAPNIAVSGIPTGNQIVEFKAVDGWITPLPAPISVVANLTVFLTPGLGTYGSGTVNQAPDVPSNPYPPNGEVNIARSGLTLTWSGGHPTGSPDFAVAFGTVNPPPFVAGFGSVPGRTYNPTANGPLLPATTYYWRVQGKVGEQRTDGPVWRFTTDYSYADLIPYEMAVDGNIQPGADVTVRVKVKNQGTFTSAVSCPLKLYLSHTPQGRERQLNQFSTLYVPALAPGAEVEMQQGVSLANLAAGQSFVDAWVDSATYGINEKDYENNVRSLAIQYVDGQSPMVTSARLGIPFVKTGQSNSIVYFATDDVGIKTVDFYYSINGGVDWVAIQEGHVPPASLANGVFLPWTIPASLPLDSNLLVRVVARDASGNWGETSTIPYLIHNGTAPVVKVLFPNGGEALPAGSVQQIRWSISAPNGVANASLTIYYDNNTTSTAQGITDYTTGTYSWTLPANLTTTVAKIRLTLQDLNGNNSEDWSDGPFSIVDNSQPPPAPWTAAAAVTSVATGDPAGSPKIVADSTGTLHLIYGLSHDAAAHTISFRYRKRVGTTWTSPAVVSFDVANLDNQTGSSYNIGNWRFTVDGNGHPHLVWATAFNYFASEEGKSDVFYTSYDGANWAAPQNVSSSIKSPLMATSIAWARKADMPVPSSTPAAVAVGGKLYFIHYDQLHQYDPNANTWTRKADAPPAAVGDGGATVVNGLIYAAGTPYDGNIRIYNPSENTWSTGAAMPSPQQGVRLAAAANGMVYAIGGDSPKTRMYNPGANSWATLADMPTVRSYPAVAAVGTKVYVIGGYPAKQSMDVYDTVGNTWSTQAFPIAANIPQSFGGFAAVANEKVYFFPGGLFGDAVPSREVWEYDPATGCWTRMQPTLFEHRFAGCGAAIGSKLYVLGGYDGSNQSSSMEEAILSTALAGTYSSAPQVVVDAANTVHVLWNDGSYLQPDGSMFYSFSFAGERNVYEVVKNGAGWSAPLQVTTGGVRHHAVVADQFGNLHLSDQAYNGDIAYRQRVGNSWSAPILAGVSLDGFGLDMAIDSTMKVHVLYGGYNSQTSLNSLNYITLSGNSWSSPERVSSILSGFPPRLSLDSLNRPHAIWQDSLGNPQVLYSTRSGGGWVAPIQLNRASETPAYGSIDAALRLGSNELDVVWLGANLGNPNVLFNFANVGSALDIYPPTVVTVSPAYGDILSIGNQTTITWAAADNVDVTVVDLHFTTNNSASLTLITSNLANNGSFSWTVPDLGTNSAQVRVTARDAVGNAGVGFSGTFSTADLTPPTIAFTAPTGSAVLTGGSTPDISWSATDNVGVVRIDLEFSLDSGTTWLGMATNLANTGTYPWTVPSVPTSTLLLRATAQDAAGFSATFTSQPLTIVRGNFPPLTPSGLYPLNGAGDESLTPTLYGSTFGDPDGDTHAASQWQVLNGAGTAVVWDSSEDTTNRMSRSVLPGQLAYGTTYRFHVRYKDSRGLWSDYSPQASFTTTPVISPTVSSQATNVTVLQGLNANFAIAAEGTAPMSYQWFFNATNALAGATNATLGLTNVQPANSGNYAVVVTNMGGSVTSGVAVLTVLVPPSLVTQPTNTTANALSDAVISVDATGTAPLFYQWFKSGSVVTNATNATLTLTAVTTNSAGAYQVVITNMAGSVTSSVSVLTVNRLAQTIGFGSLLAKRVDDAPFTLSATASSGLSVSYTSSNPGVAIVSGNIVTITGIGSTTITASQVGDATYLPGADVSQTLIVSATGIPPSITTQPTSMTVNVTSNASFSVTATGTAPLSYQWRKEGLSLTGATSASLTLSDVQTNQAGNYTVVITNAYGSVTSSVAVLTVNEASGGILGQFLQQGPKLVGTGAVGGKAWQGNSVSLSADGSTAIVGGPLDNGYAGAAWIWTRSGGVWTQQGEKLFGSGSVGTQVFQGQSVSLSADGNTAIVGGHNDNNGVGAAWVWTRSGGIWSQQGDKLVGSDVAGVAGQGISVSISADGNTAIVGGYAAAWVWTRSGGVWTQQGTKLVGSGAVGDANQGISVSISADGNTAIVGGRSDNNSIGAAWVWSRSGGVWTQQGEKLVGSGSVGTQVFQGQSVSLSADGNTAIVGGYRDNGNGFSGTGAAWVWTRSGGVWTQQGTKLVGSGAVGDADQGESVSLSADGNTAIVGGSNDNSDAGAAWVWRRSAGVWTQQGTKLVGSGAGGIADQGISVSLSADGNTAIVGGSEDNNQTGAAWVFSAAAPAVLPAAITTQPSNQAVNAGANATFTVTASGTPIPTLQWQVSTNAGMTWANLTNTPPYNGVTSATLVVTATPLNLDGAQYRAVATNSAGSATSSVATLIVSASAGSVVFSNYGPGNSVGTSGSYWDTGEHLPEQPYHRGMPFTVPPGTSFRLDSINVTAFQSGSVPPVYIVSVNADLGGIPGVVLEQFTFTNFSGTSYSNPILLTGTSVLQPVLSAGMQYWLTTDVSSPTTMNVGWPFNNQGSVGLVAWHPGNASWSRPSGSVPQTLGAFSITGSPTASTAPAITTQPTNVTVVAGSNATLSVVATGTGLLGYQWFFNATNVLTGATNASLTVTNAQPVHAGSYTVAVTNVAGSVTSSVAVLTVLVPVAITSQPQGQLVVVGADANFSVSATGTGPLFYQWRLGGVVLPNATNATLAVVAVTTNHAGAYSVVVSNAATAATSQAAMLTVAHSFFSPPPPQSAQAVRTSGFQLSLVLEVGRTFTVQASSDFVTWQAVTNFTSTGAALQFLDMAATNSNRRFYRVVSP